MGTMNRIYLHVTYADEHDTPFPELHDVVNGTIDSRAHDMDDDANSIVLDATHANIESKRPEIARLLGVDESDVIISDDTIDAFDFVIPISIKTDENVVAFINYEIAEWS